MRSALTKIMTFLLAAILVVGMAVSSSAADENMIAEDRDAYTYGVIGYLERDQMIRSLPKKSVAYVTQILDGAGRVVAADEVVKGHYYRYSLVEGINTFNPEAIKSCSMLGGITYDFFSKADYEQVLQETSADGEHTPYYVLSADELMDADVIVTSGCIPMKAMIDSLGTREYKGVIVSEIPKAFSDEEKEDEKALTRSFLMGSAFCDSVDPVELCAYYYEHFLGIGDRDKLEKKVNAAFKPIEFYKDIENTLSDGYESSSVEWIIKEGTYFYLDNRDVFKGGAFDENGMSKWEPDLSLAGSILGPEEPETEPEAITETGTGSQPEPESVTETETQTETETTAETTVPETTQAEEPVYELPSWIVAAAAAVVVMAGLLVYIIRSGKKN